MTVANYPVGRAPRPSGLADVLDVVLDKGIVIDAYIRVALVGIEILTIDARIVIASVDTYLRFAEAVNRLDMQPRNQVAGLPGLMHEVTGATAKHGTAGALGSATGALAKGAVGELKETAQNVAETLRGSPSSAGSSPSSAGSDGRDLPPERAAPPDRRYGREA